MVYVTRCPWKHSSVHGRAPAKPVSGVPSALRRSIQNAYSPSNSLFVAVASPRVLRNERRLLRDLRLARR